MFGADDPTAAMGAAATAFNRGLGRPGVVDCEFFPRLQRAPRADDHFVFVRVRVVRCVVDELACRLATVIQIAERLVRFEQAAIAEVDGILGSFGIIEEDRAAHPPHLLTTAQPTAREDPLSVFGNTNVDRGFKFGHPTPTNLPAKFIIGRIVYNFQAGRI